VEAERIGEEEEATFVAHVEACFGLPGIPPRLEVLMTYLDVRVDLLARRTREDEGNRAVVYLGESIHSGYVLIKRDHLTNVTSPEHERWKRAHPEVCRQMGIG